MRKPLKAILKEEQFLAVSVISSLGFFFFGRSIADSLSNPFCLGLVFIWLFVAILGSIFCVVRHADHLAARLGEPYGTLILTLAVTAIEVLSISATMLHGANNPTLARDTIFGVVMIVLNGMVGLSLLIGGWRHREQHYNFQSANTYLGLIIPLASLPLLLPIFTVTTPGPILSSHQESFLAVMAVGLYATFLVMQTSRHRAYFTYDGEKPHHDPLKGTTHPLLAHVTLLLIYMVPVAYLSEQLAPPIDELVETMHLPAALGGLIIALLVATPEAISAVRAAYGNHLQRSVNISLGSVLATIGLTVPSMLVVSHLTGRKITLGLEHTDLVLLPLTLLVGVVTFASGRTNILQGAVHLLLFAAYLMLIFES